MAMQMRPHRPQSVTTVGPAAPRRSGLLAAATLLAAAGLPVCSATAQTTRTFTSISAASWFSDADWSPGPHPGSLDTAILSSGSPFPTHARINVSTDAAVAMQLILATTGRGWLEHSDGTLTVGDRITLGQSGGLGELDIRYRASTRAHELFVGQDGGGILTIDSSPTDATHYAALDVDHLVVAAGAASFYEKRMTQTGNSKVTVHGALEVGLAGPGTYQFRGGDLSTHRLLVAGPGSTGTGTFSIGPSGASDSLPILLVDDDVQVGGGTAAGITGTLFNNGGAIVGTAAASELFVHDGKGKLVGTGLYSIKVTYLDAVNVSFPKNSLLTAATMSVAPGLTVGNAGSGPPGDTGEVVGKFTPRLLAGSAQTVTWSEGTADSAHVNYNSTTSASPAPSDPTIEIPCDPSTATGTARVPAANIATRVRMLQFGENVLAAHLNGSTSPALDKPGEIRGITQPGGVLAGRVIGQSPHISGDFSVAVLGTAADPVHQNPHIAELHDGAADLRGRGIVMGQLEPGIPDTDFGSFEDWSMATGKRASVLASGGGSITSHATFVASVMVGYDPLGVQVDGQSKFEPAANRYGRTGSEGFGFSGVAPDATLVSINWAGAPGADVNTLAAQPGMKVINQSAGFPTPPVGTNPVANGSSTEERTIDHQVEDKGLIYVVAAGNSGTGGASTIWTPGGAYNGITAANAEFESGTPSAGYPRTFDATAASTIPRFTSSLGPTGDGRCKPDLAAQGADVLGAFIMTDTGPAGGRTDPAYPLAGNHGLYSVRSRTGPGTDVTRSGTSFSAPQIAGVAALMVEQARKNGSAAAEDPRVVKSILQTTADKPVGWSKGVPGPGDDAPTIPLDYTWGAGIMNPPKAVSLLDTAMIPHDAGPITRDGWSLSSLSDTDTTAFGFGGQSFLLHDLAVGGPLTATLNWYRHVSAAPFTSIVLLNLDLQLYTWDPTTSTATLLPPLSSVSTIDNVEHIFVPASILTGGDFLLRISAASFAGLAGEMYGLSWDATFVPSPGAAGMGLLVVTVSLTRRNRRA